MVMVWAAARRVSEMQINEASDVSEASLCLMLSIGNALRFPSRSRAVFRISGCYSAQAEKARDWQSKALWHTHSLSTHLP